MSSLRAYRFHQVDVFTDRALAGNPLAVFVDPGNLAGDLMQAIAREMNLSETRWQVVPVLDGTLWLPGQETDHG